jgi:hypothetical protein
VTPSATPLEGNLEILKVLPLPNPQTGPGIRLAVKVSGAGVCLKVRAYTSAMNLAGETEAPGNYATGWNMIRCDWTGLGNGLYFVVVEDCGKKTKGIAKVVLLGENNQNH